MTISLNGEPSQTRGAETVAELVQRCDLHPESILIEHNGVALHRREWPQRKLSDGDRIEIVHVVAGG